MRKKKIKTHLENFLKRFNESDIAKTLREQDDFETAASIEIFNRDILEDATIYIHSYEMLGKDRRSVINPEDHFVLDFENEDDAICFKLKFAGAVHTNR